MVAADRACERTRRAKASISGLARTYRFDAVHRVGSRGLDGRDGYDFPFMRRERERAELPVVGEPLVFPSSLTHTHARTRCVPGYNRQIDRVMTDSSGK